MQKLIISITGKNKTHQGFVQSLIVLMVGELNTLSF